MMYEGGYAGRILRVDLSMSSISTEPLAAETARSFLGGAGLGISLLLDGVVPGADPLGAANRLIFAVGPLTGTTLPCANRVAVVAKSPLTNAVGLSLSGGHFPIELRRAGYDALVIDGVSAKPVFLYVHDDRVQLKDASQLWGTSTTDCQLLVKEQLGEHGARIACIGPAGEQLSRLACIINERRAAGRKGLGAVMGAKNLKAIAVRGTRDVGVADPDRFAELRRDFLAAMRGSPILYSLFAKRGTSIMVDGTSELGILPAKNWLETGTYAPLEQLGTDAQDKLTLRRAGCANCPIRCTQMRSVDEGPYAGAFSEGPEFETTYAFGTSTGNDNWPSIVAADRMCDEFGLDTVSAGVAIGFAMELHEKGLLSREDCDGLDLRFGNHEAMLKLLRRMAFREGLGGILADGVRIAAERIGKGTDAMAMHVKGLELPGYDVRGAKGHGLNYATSFTGADHARGYAFQEIFGMPIPEAVDRFAASGKGRLTKWNQDMRIACCDSPTLCGFLVDMAIPANAADVIAELSTAATGLVFSGGDVMAIGERITNVARVFNLRQGLTRADDNLPRRLMTTEIPGGASAGHRIAPEEFEEMLAEYYQERGWDSQGVPRPEKLAELGLQSLID